MAGGVVLSLVRAPAPAASSCGPRLRGGGATCWAGAIALCGLIAYSFWQWNRVAHAGAGLVRARVSGTEPALDRHGHRAAPIT